MTDRLTPPPVAPFTDPQWQATQEKARRREWLRRLQDAAESTEPNALGRLTGVVVSLIKYLKEENER
jgi:hypothetical protein